MKYRYPKRWSRERRKRARAVARHLVLVVLPALKITLDKVWGDMMVAPTWQDYGFVLGQSEFIDDAEFLP